MASKLDVALTCARGVGVDVWDVVSGAHLKTVPIPTASGAVALLGPHSHLFLCPDADKPSMQLWSWRHGHNRFRSAIAEKIEVLAVSHDQQMCVGGARSGRLYIWDLVSGDLLRTWDAHYKAISALTFTPDDAYIVSGGEDAIINLWSVFDIFAGRAIGSQSASSSAVNTEDSVQAARSWSDHALAVTQLWCSSGPSAGRLFSSSLDRTCKIWDIPSGMLLHSLSFASQIHTITVEPAERFLYAGAADGTVYQVDLINGVSTGAASSSAAFGTAGAAATSIASSSNGPLQPLVFSGHTKAITSLSLSYDGSRLLTGSMDGTARIWDTRSRQSIKVLSKQRIAYTAVSFVTDFDGAFGDDQAQKRVRFRVLIVVCFLCCAYQLLIHGASRLYLCRRRSPR